MRYGSTCGFTENTLKGVAMSMDEVLIKLGPELLLGAVVRSEVHDALRRHSDDENISESFHPGDTIGRVVSQLWLHDQHTELAKFVAEYMAEIRVFAENRPPVGKRLTFVNFLHSLRFAIHQDAVGMTNADVDELLDYLDSEAPHFYSEYPDEIDEA